MIRQPSFAQAEFAEKKKTTRREKFLARMEEVIPWARLLAVIGPFYPKGQRGRPPIGLERMLRVYFLQQWYGLADEAIEDALYDSQALRNFARIDLSAEGVPDATTFLKFRRRLETHDLCKGLFTAINADLAARGLLLLLLREGTLVDATLIAAPSSTKNQAKQRDPEMHRTKKGNQWHFGMKAHSGADRDGKLAHAVVITAANVADVTQPAERLHGQEMQVHADAGYTGVEKRAEIVALERKTDWQIAGKRGLIQALAGGAEKAARKACVTTMLDYCGLAPEFPGRATPVGNNALERVASVELACATDIDNLRFVPYLALHEFEAMLFAVPTEIAASLGQPLLQTPRHRSG